MAKTEKTCETCVHERDSGSEFCGSCDDLSSSWTEKPEGVEKRISKRTNDLEALCRQLAAACEDSLRRVNDLDCECDSYEGFVCGKHSWQQILESALEAAKKAGIKP